MKKMKKKSLLTEDYLIWAEVDLRAVEHNFKEVRRLAARNEFAIPTRNNQKERLIDPIQILAVIKADAYGHGMKEIGLLLDRLGCGFLAVSDITEGMILRKTGIRKPILLFESTLPSHAKQIVDYQLMPTVCTIEMAKSLNRYAQKTKTTLNIHVEIDTGMGRLGVWHKEAFDFIRAIYRLKYLIVHGIYTHFPVADTDRRFTKKQIKQLYELVVRLDKSGFVVPFIHAANSMGLAGYKTNVLNIVRPGLMVYGLYPFSRLKKEINLKPVLSVKSKVIFLKNIAKGRSISYGRTFIAKRKMKVATVPIGYNDGYLRDFSNKAFVLVDGVRCPVMGRVTMDQIVIDVSKVNKVMLGTSVTILGTQKEKSVTADELADYADTINYEIVCNLGNRLVRVYK